MATSDPRLELIQRARFLRNAAPQAFIDFHAAFAVYADAKTKELLVVTERFSQVQGQAQQCKALLDIFDGVKNG